MIEDCRRRVDANKWPVITKVAGAQDLDLDFDDDFFNFSFTNFAAASLTDPEKAATHLFRTLKPRERAIVCTWGFMPHNLPLEKADLATRGDDA
ncbi:hypothetical protein BGZ60DRAFT_405281 [Tricladium varicosporioides]|nr:hypothetical protein BGZ60DRAFT_405281 [Hymenoscyphus varicosporioides]